MDNVEAMDVRQPLQDLSEETPDFLCVFVQIASDEIAKSL